MKEETVELIRYAVKRQLDVSAGFFKSARTRLKLLRYEPKIFAWEEDICREKTENLSRSVFWRKEIKKWNEVYDGLL